MGLWFPQIIIFLMLLDGTVSLELSCEMARFSSNLVRAEKAVFGMLGANFDRIMQLVFAGLPTTTIFTFLFAYLLMAFPCSLKIAAFCPSKSFLSIPGPLGFAPTNIPTSQSLNPSS